MSTYRMVVQYEGTRYKGWQRLKGEGQTIQGKIESVLSRLLQTQIEIHGSGRTDAGVHAAGQVAHFKTEVPIDGELILKEVNQYLPEDIAILSIEHVDERFHARYQAKSKTYVYRIWLAPYPPVFERSLVYQYSGETLPDVEKMEQAAKRFLGTHDFRGFSSDKTKKSTVRTLFDLTFEQTDTELKLFLTADGFLYNMARIIAGTLLDVGTGVVAESDIEPVFLSGKREGAGETAPAKGLTLLEVHY